MYFLIEKSGSILRISETDRGVFLPANFAQRGGEADKWREVVRIALDCRLERLDSGIDLTR